MNTLCTPSGQAQGSPAPATPPQGPCQDGLTPGGGGRLSFCVLSRKTHKGILPAGPRLVVAVALRYFRLHLRLCGQDITTDQPLLVNDQPARLH